LRSRPCFPGRAKPEVQHFLVGYGTKAECIAAVRQYPGVEIAAKIVPKERLSLESIAGERLRDGEVRQNMT
jgi:hypothetical protein